MSVVPLSPPPQLLQLQQPLPVQQVDEGRSSIEAAQRFAAGRAAGARKRSQADQLDAVAAVVILERCLADPGTRTSLDPGEPTP